MSFGIILQLAIIILQSVGVKFTATTTFFVLSSPFYN